MQKNGELNILNDNDTTEVVHHFKFIHVIWNEAYDEVQTKYIQLPLQSSSVTSCSSTVLYPQVLFCTRSRNILKLRCLQAT